LSLPWGLPGSIACGTGRFDWTSHETLTGFMSADLPESELVDRHGVRP
jgi:hypothetical protein